MNNCNEEDNLFKLFVVKYSVKGYDVSGFALVVGTYPSDVIQTFTSRGQFAAYKDDLIIEEITTIPRNLSEDVIAEIYVNNGNNDNSMNMETEKRLIELEDRIKALEERFKNLLDWNGISEEDRKLFNL